MPDSLRSARPLLAAICLTCATVTPALAQRQIEAGPIWNQAHADQVCPAVAHAHGGRWTGQWRTTVQGRMSVCEVRANPRAVESGPIWNQAHADQVCPAVAQSHGARWTGQWWTTVQGRMSVCEIR